MRIEILQENLSKALNHVVKAVSSRPNIPVLANVLIQTEKGKIKLSATNLEIGINAWIGADIKEEGSITVSAKLLSEFINSIKPGKISLAQNGQTFEVKSVDNNAEFFIIPAEDFPNVPQAEKDPIMIINAFELADSISKTVFASAADDSRPVLTGILFEAKGDAFKMVGVDGFRLSKVELKLTKGPKDLIKEIVPSKSLQEVERIIRDSSNEKEDVEIYMLGDKNQILFKVGDVELSSRIIEGEFPDYTQIIPSDKSNSFSVLKSELQSAVKIISIFAKNIIGNKTKFNITPLDKKLKLSANVIDIGNNETSVDISKTEGESLETAYNAKFLMEMINSMDGDEIVYETGGVTAPGVFKTKEKKNYIHIIMPMRSE
jgi:DNA polymerase-3 subunit beta